jgi:murein L,D-transpeptidase YcbB/YkuD
VTRIRPAAVIPTLLSLCVLTAVLTPMEGCKATRRAAYNLFHHRKAKSKSNTTDYADNVEDVVNSHHLAIMKWSNFTDYQAEVQQFYDDRSFELAWTRDGKPTAAASTLIDNFVHADRKGLTPDDYDASRWPQRLARVETIRNAHDTSDNAQTVIAQFDAAMTITAMRYLADLHVGRVNPQSLNFDIDVPAKRAAFDMPTFLNDQLVDSGDVNSAVTSVEPQNPMYQATEQALGRYLVLAQQQAAQPQQPLPAIAHAVSVGGSYPALPQLLARLQLEGDAGDSTPTNDYDEATAAAVRHFQQRYGLTPDGKLTQQTIAELNVPLTARIQQFDDALERWRWLPDNFIKPRVLVNLPEFLVRTYDPDGNLQFKMKVVDGEAEGNHDTPMFVRSMRYVVFRPYWNLPISIIKKELAAHLDKDPGYLAAHNYEVVTNTGQPTSGWTVSDLIHGRYIVRQKPGPKNSLGLIKFMFPNEYDVYMHSTPEMNLFNLTRRDHSHGCIRLNDAEKMANWVLNGQGDWDADKIHDAMYGDNDNKTVGLKNTLPVTITYLTANADEDGTVHFFDDIYGYDRQLNQALAQPRPYDKSEHKINPKLTPGETE